MVRSATQYSTSAVCINREQLSCAVCEPWWRSVIRYCWVYAR